MFGFAAGFAFPLEGFRFVPARGERLEMKPHPKRAFSSSIKEKKTTWGNFLDSTQPIITFEKLICCSCFRTPPKATTPYDYTTTAAFMAECKHYPGFVVLQKPMFGLKTPLDF